jgi:SNF2 family DNA or RNA helicase
MKLTLEPHQVEALDHLRANPRAALFLGMSLQKTVITLLYLREMIYEECAFTRVLIIAPDKVARLTWPDEIGKWEDTSYMRYSVVAGAAANRVKALQADAEIFIIGVDNLVWMLGLYPQALPFDCLVIDELSLFKGRSSQRFLNLRRALSRSKVNYRVGLTGTPLPNGLIDLWAQLRLIDDGERLGGKFGTYVDKYFVPRGNGMVTFEYRPKPDAEKVISGKIADIVLSMQTRDHKKLPDLVLEDTRLTFEPFDQEVYDTLEEQYVLDFDDSEVTVKNGADLVSKLLQISSGAIYSDREAGFREWHELNTVKLDALEDLVSRYPDENVLVVYQFKHEVERIKKRFPHAVTLPKGKALKQCFDDWNAGKIKMMVIHPASAGHGLNLQFGGRRMIWTSPTWNLEHWLQTLARLLRHGATETIYVHRLLVKGTRDMQVKRRIERKDDNQKFILDEIKRLRAKYNRS